MFMKNSSLFCFGFLYLFPNMYGNQIYGDTVLLLTLYHAIIVPLAGVHVNVHIQQNCQSLFIFNAHFLPKKSGFCECFRVLSPEAHRLFTRPFRGLYNTIHHFTSNFNILNAQI
jgi:hypothetical protein